MTMLGNAGVCAASRDVFKMIDDILAENVSDETVMWLESLKLRINEEIVEPAESGWY